jgi:hypothetical protein
MTRGKELRFLESQLIAFSADKRVPNGIYERVLQVSQSRDLGHIDTLAEHLVSDCINDERMHMHVPPPCSLSTN